MTHENYSFYMYCTQTNCFDYFIRVQACRKTKLISDNNR